MALRWYVVHAYSNFEHRVQESLKERIRRAGLEPKFGEILEAVETRQLEGALRDREEALMWVKEEVERRKLLSS